MKRKNKFNSKRTEVDGIYFDSLAEAKEFRRLRALEDAGKIAELRLQPSFDCVVNGVLICRYRADFSYLEGRCRRVRDVKGVSTPVFKIKKKLVEALHSVEIEVIPAH